MSIATTTTTRVLAPILDLVGTDVSGIRAQVRTRYDWPDWEPKWRTLKSVELKMVKGEQWVYVRWQKDGANDCGYSGRHLSVAEDWVIEVEG